MLFAPDFFGNPATGNFWGKDYGEFMSYFGIVTLILGAIGFYTNHKNKIVRLSLITTIVALLTAFVPQIAELIFRSPIPILNTGLPSRALFLVGVGFAIASAFGIEAIQNEKLKKLLPPIIVILGIYTILWIVAFTMRVDPTVIASTRRNLLLPTGIALLISGVILGRKWSKFFFLIWLVVFACMGFEYSYFLNKYLPSAPLTYMFPKQELVTKLSQIAGNNRIYGYDTATIGTNLPVQWRLQSIEGYDSLYIKSYAELMRAATTGKLEVDLPRSDANLPHSLPVDDSHNKQVLLNLLGVKYVIDKDDTMPKELSPRTDRFPTERFSLIYQQYKWKIYENKQALPRAAVFYDYAIISEHARSVQTLFDTRFPYQRRLILSQKPNFLPKASPITPAKITAYTANNVSVETQTKQPGLLFLSDNYYPGWEAFVDNHPVRVLTADYSFRAIEIPQGKHTVLFSYRPYSFYLGVLISFTSLLLLGFTMKKKIR
jgi:hypothetical protein